ncbi:translation initiation factor fusion with methylthioribose kinase [Ochromonadaceae sp. CCMP2298]|nr:translation initiation factor fusion with methylthioribose kinase [Ochromonadaceae sp. CCMP2298]|eukprot:CAMPEP_0173306864 /NCGR_PEP_ID=MMETSP1143-20121109/20822_1 /TAXON_ID=483371 /ORGANISM="non described non described, Strain CCMP2298" /LENGTH=842 /DNA_ID=CAMNT_0014248013 /DNA_START=18 /DNA_END=2546 /DNA_ORIENTATION=+
MSKLLSLKYSRGSLAVLDQLKIPHESVFIDVPDVNEAWSVIRLMQVRGAPLIAIVAALGLAVEVEKRKGEFSSASDAADWLLERMTYLRTSRPTAVNLFTATDELSALVGTLRARNISALELVEEVIGECEAMLEDDVTANRAMGRFGAERILQLVDREKIRVLTICNTGSLATAGFGTALGVVRSLHEMGRLEHVYACETRPYNQGARLTAYEIVQDELPGSLICDSMASALMAVKGVDCVVVGADRIAANGDTANKIGTYQLAIAAKYHGVPFFTAAPTTTLDLCMKSGGEIEIEERPSKELTTIFGRSIAPEGINAWNPAFDVTPCVLIRGVITEIGVVEAPARNTGPVGGLEVSEDLAVIPLASFLSAFAENSANDTSPKAAKAMQVLRLKCAAAASPSSAPVGYAVLDASAITKYLLANAKLAALLNVDPALSGALAEQQLDVLEVGDGNLNFVYIVTGPGGSKLVVKQALPYVRCVGESWPLTLRRAYFEYSALTAESNLTGGAFVPEVYHFDAKKSVIVMRYIEPPHLILRKALIQGMQITTFAADIGSFMARTLIASSGIVLEGAALRAQTSHWSQNVAMCALTEKVIFTDPYTHSDMNRWTTPQLDSYAEGIRADEKLKLAAAYHKTLFLTHTQALLHGDLHTGSVMVKEGSTFVIDPEFAFYGPMGFDIGAILSNLFLSYFSHSASPAYAEWVLSQTALLHETFVAQFLALWDDKSLTKDGELYKSTVYEGQVLRTAQTDFMSALWRDSLGFAGTKMIRRIVGIAHVEDLDSIADQEVRAVCEKKALLFARKLVLASFSNETYEAGGLGSMQEVITQARLFFASVPPAAYTV